MGVRRVLVAGIVASLVMGMIEMIYEGVAGTGFWSPAVYIGATVLRGLQSVRIPVGFDFWGVVLGLMGHMMNSVIFGLLFTTVFARSARSRGGLVMSGVIYSLVIFFVMWYVVAPIVDPVLLNLNATVFAIAHIMWGGTLGLLVPRADPTEPRTRAAV
jgi:hypothetical protein